jgi:hypothetical protein
MWGMSDDPILTYAQVRAWQARRNEIDNHIQALQDEHIALSRKLEAVRVIMGDLPTLDGEQGEPKTEHAPLDQEDSEGSEPFPETVLLAVGALGGAPIPRMIRRWLKENGSTAATRARADAPYFYTTLMRHAAGGRLIKEGEGYRLPTSSPQGEAGADDPGRLTRLTPNDQRTVRSSAEAGGT